MLVRRLRITISDREEGVVAEGKIAEIKLPDGSSLRAEDMDYDVENENWNKYRLSDGTQVKIRTVISNIYWVVDDDGNHHCISRGS